MSRTFIVSTVAAVYDRRYSKTVFDPVKLTHYRLPGQIAFLAVLKTGSCGKLKRPRAFGSELIAQSSARLTESAGVNVPCRREVVQIGNIEEVESFRY